VETFVVRVWRPAAEEVDVPTTPLRGVVEHVGTGRSDPFQGTERLAELIAAALPHHDHDVSAPTEEKGR